MVRTLTREVPAADEADDEAGDEAQPAELLIPEARRRQRSRYRRRVVGTVIAVAVLVALLFAGLSGAGTPVDRRHPHRVAPEHVPRREWGRRRSSGRSCASAAGRGRLPSRRHHCPARARPRTP